jgi:hypothetical protein
MVISAADLENYTGKKLDNGDALQTYVDSALDIIKNYIGYDPEIGFHTEIIRGYGTDKIQLKHKPVNLVYKITDYETGDILFEAKQSLTQDYIASEEFVTFKNMVLPDRRLIAEYIGGWGFMDYSANAVDGGDAETVSFDPVLDCGTAEDFDFFNLIPGGSAVSIGVIENNIPVLFKQTALRIAALLLTEADNNIGITSKSFGDSGSRTFVSYTNFDKYLFPLSRYKLIVI